MRILDKIKINIQKNKKMLAVLVDPDLSKLDYLDQIIEQGNRAGVDFFFIGGSLLMNDQLDYTINTIKANSNIPCVLFPGNEFQVHANADALLFLSLLSGRNVDYIIGKHVLMASKILESGIECIPTSYILHHQTDGSSAQYISQTFPIPHSKPQIAAQTALAGQLLGKTITYLEGGSGNDTPIPTKSIKAIKKVSNLPLIVGGGILTIEKMMDNFNAGADIQVIGTLFEKDPSLIFSFCNAMKNH